VAARFVKTTHNDSVFAERVVIPHITPLLDAIGSGNASESEPIAQSSNPNGFGRTLASAVEEVTHWATLLAKPGLLTRACCYGTISSACWWPSCYEPSRPRIPKLLLNCPYWTSELISDISFIVTDAEKQVPLGEALHFLRMSGVAYCRSDFTAPWGLFLPLAEGCARFHLVVSGTAILREGEYTLKLETGDLVLIPHGHGHALLDNPKSSVVQLEDLKQEHQDERYALFRHGGGGAQTQLVCVRVRFDHPAAHQLIAQLPKFIHVKAASSREMEWLNA